jgi:hypothetical protein
MSALFPDPFTTATAELPPRFASAFARLTSCAEPNELAAGRFMCAMLGNNVVEEEVPCGKICGGSIVECR